jgi:hypothetical protein
MKYFLALFFVVLIAASCRSTKKIGSAISKKDTVAVKPVDAHADSINFMKSVLARVSANHIEFNTFTAKLNIDYKDNNGKNYDVNATLRMYKDSAIWISANALLGIEAIRALITKDSVKIIDKLNKTVTLRSVDYLQEVTALPLDLRTIQDLLLGNPVYLDSNLLSYTRSGTSVSILTAGQWFKNLLTLSEAEGLIQHSKLSDVNPARNRTADLQYTEYENKKGVNFAAKRKISISEAKKLDIKLDFKQYDFNGEVSFPFSIPKNFKRN